MLKHQMNVDNITFQTHTYKIQTDKHGVELKGCKLRKILYDVYLKMVQKVHLMQLLRLAYDNLYIENINLQQS